MIKEIKYNGFTATPSDYESPDGDLAAAVNIIPEDETLRPILPPATLFTLPSKYKYTDSGTEHEVDADYSILFIHDTAAITHYIILLHYITEGTLYERYRLTWLDADNIPDTTAEIQNQLNLNIISYDFADDVPQTANAVGNTLIVIAQRSMNYILWSGNAYTYLGNQLPDIQLNIGLLGRPRFYSLQYGSTFDITFDSIAASDIFKPLSEDNQVTITEQVMARLNKFIADTTVNHGRHCFPFFVRYALRLYDGSLTMQSPPILMNPCTTGGPVVMWERIEGEDNYTQATINMMLMAATLTYRANSSADQTRFSQWSDIVKSIDIFISKPIYTFDQNGKIDSFADNDNFNTKFIGKLYAHMTNDGYIDTATWGEPEKSRPMAPITNVDYIQKYSEWPYSQIYALYFEKNRTRPNTTLHLPEFNEEKVSDSIYNTANFYLLHSISLSELTTNDTEIVTPNDFLPALVTREKLNDDYLSHDKLIPAYIFPYNNRLHLGAVKHVLYDGAPAEVMFAKCETYHSFVVSDTSEEVPRKRVTLSLPIGDTASIDLYTYIKNDGKEYIVKSQGSKGLMNFFTKTYSGTTADRSAFCWFFYPNVNAYKMVVVQNVNGFNVFNVTLKPHEFLNGSYALLEYQATRTSQGTVPTVSNDTTIPQPNKIYTSEVNNPFYFPALGINTVGTGTILGISSAVKALSQGQFGQFPLYAFTDEGVWALELDSTGSFKARQPVTRDVCISSKSITQIDSAVLFATDRGIMLISGSNSQCISDILNSETPFSPSELPHIDNVLTDYPSVTTVPFMTFLQDCRMLYNYTRQRIIVFNPEQNYAYVYSLKSKQWGMMLSDIKSSINSYPSCLASIQVITTVPPAQEGGEPTQVTTNDIVNFSATTPAAESTTEPATPNESTDPATVTETAVSGLLITRPLKLDQPDLLKTIDTIIQRGHFRKGHVKTILYGSRDLFNWQLIYSSTDHYLRGFRGTPYKYFRIALLCSLTKDESIFGCTIQFTPRLINQPR